MERLSLESHRPICVPTTSQDRSSIKIRAHFAVWPQNSDMTISSPALILDSFDREILRRYQGNTRMPA
jgi:hypothetical protein